MKKYSSSGKETAIELKFHIFFSLVIIIITASACYGQDLEKKGYQIAREADKRASDFGDFTAEMDMILRNKNGRESLRKIRVKAVETKEDGDKSLTIFLSPPDVKGTALLTHGHKIADDDQWLFLPALKRVKRISSKNKAGAFMGSEFSFEDLGSQEIEKYSYKFIKEQAVDDFPCFVIERYPKDTKNSGYSKVISWIDKEEYRIIKEDYFDKKKRFLKTLRLSNYQRYIERIWRAHNALMINHQSGKQTELIWSDYAFKTGLDDRDFDKNSLKRAR